LVHARTTCKHGADGIESCTAISVEALLVQHLAELIRTQRDEIVRRWEHGVWGLPHARILDEPRLRDHIPALLERIADVTEDVGSGRSSKAERDIAERHARTRLDEGFDINEIITEFCVLRDVVFQLLDDPATGGVTFAEMRALNSAIDEAIGDSVERYTNILRDQTRVLADNIPQLAWMCDPAGVVYWCNRRLYEFTGTGPEDLGTWSWQRFHDPAHVDRVKERWDRCLAVGEPWEDTFPLRGKDGYYRWFLSRAVPIRDANGTITSWFGTNTDVTARRFVDEASRVLGRSLDYRETLELVARLAVPDLADWCFVDLVDDNQIVQVAMVHRDEASLELVRNYLHDHPGELGRQPGTLEALRTGQAQHVFEISDELIAASTQEPERLAMLRRLGYRSWIGAPLIALGAPIGIIHLVMSDSGRTYTDADVEVAAELGRRAGVAVENARLYRRAKESVHVRENVLAVVSHDLRNPLGAIGLGATLLMQQFGDDPRAQKHLETIRRSATRMEHLIDDLLDMASINAGKFTIKRGAVDVGQLVHEAVDMHEQVANERGIRLVDDTADVRGLRLQADRNRMLQVFSNLLGNSLKFCSEGDLITVGGRREQGHIRFEVSDTGPGIAGAELPHIFEPYWSGATRTKKGTGLGLFITKAIIEAHGGDIDVASEPGKGATFTMRIPLAAA
jgi:PAS domain S-box-containing protein